MGFLDPVVTIDKPLWRRLRMLISELAYMADGEELGGIDLDRQCEEFIRRVIDEYVRQYFEESTKQVAQLLAKRHQSEQVEPRFWLR